MGRFTRGFMGRGKAERDPRLPPGQYDTGKTGRCSPQVEPALATRGPSGPAGSSPGRRAWTWPVTLVPSTQR
jgi:hypothetical protein